MKNDSIKVEVDEGLLAFGAEEEDGWPCLPAGERELIMRFAPGA